MGSAVGRHPEQKFIHTRSLARTAKLELISQERVEVRPQDEARETFVTPIGQTPGFLGGTMSRASFPRCAYLWAGELGFS